MTASEVFELRRQGRQEEAYEAARQLYATDKSPYSAAAMFWTAVDIFRARMKEGRTVEAGKILLALERLRPSVPDKDGWVSMAMQKCHALSGNKENRSLTRREKTAKQEMGTWGEDMASAYLREKGYVILERNWHSKHRDIDIIAQKDDVVVFVEVKTRHSQDFGSPAEAVNFKKQKNLLLSINSYLKYKNIEQSWRFDVIAIVGTVGQEYVIEHIEDFLLNFR